MKKNLFLIFALLVFVFLAFVAFFQPQKKLLVDEAYQNFAQKNYLEAERILTEIEKNQQNKHLNKPICGFKGFLALAKKDFENSDRFFQKALNQTYDEYEKGKLLLARTLSCYYQKKYDEMWSFLSVAKNIENSKERHLLEAVYFYEKGAYEKANLSFKSYFEKKDYENRWMEIALQDISVPFLEVYFGHSLIEEKKFREARLLLEKNIEHTPASTLFLGYSYLKESESLPFSEKKSFLNVANCYFDRVVGNCEREKTKISLCLTSEIKKLLKGDEECFFAFSFIHLLEKWGCDECLEEVSSQLLEKMNVESELQAIAFCNTLKEEFQEGLFHDILLRDLFLLLQQDLKEKKTKNPFLAWQKIETFTTRYPENLLRDAVSTTQAQILLLLQEEKNSFSKSIKYLKFWSSLPLDEVCKQDFAKALLNQGMLFWRTENEEQKGSQILKLALLIADVDLRKDFAKDIEDFFKALYKQALAVNMVSRLSLIYDACQEFKIGFKGLLSKGELANHLADAAYFFKTHNYISAKNHAEWVAKVEPENATALKLVGLSALYLGNYVIAENYLKKIHEPDEETLKALLLCEAELKDDDKKTPLAQADLFPLE